MIPLTCSARPFLQLHLTMIAVSVEMIWDLAEFDPRRSARIRPVKLEGAWLMLWLSRLLRKMQI
jgi:hypothetical protein